MEYRPSLLTILLIWFLFGFSSSKSQEHYIEQVKELKHYDVIIVPGVPYKDPTLEIVLKARILWAKYLFDNNIARNIIFSGAAVYNPYIEGVVMRIYADSLHIPSSHTFSETRAEHSTENIYYSLLMARQLGFKKIAVATDRYQAIVIKKFMGKNCPDVEMALIEYKKIDLITAPWPEIDPSSACVDNFISLTMRESPIKRFMGTLGKNINYTECDTGSYQQRKSVFPIAGLNMFH